MTQPITISDKVSNKISGDTNIIAGALPQGFHIGTGLQADFASSFDCEDCNLFSKYASKRTVTGISNAIAAFSKLLTLGDFFPVHHSHQFFPSILVAAANLAYDKFKNSCLVIGLFADKTGIIKGNEIANAHCRNGSSTNVAQTTKHLRKQMLVANQYSRKDGWLRKKTYDEYNRERGRSPCPSSFTMPFFTDAGGAVMQDYLTQIPVGREGYIYLIHAEGTNRYKIGRSVNPIARAADIQKQAPYKLKIVRSSWTLDAPFDEAELHRRYSDWRVFGEWFELDQLLEGAEGTDKYPKTRLQAVDHELIYLLPTMQNVAIHPIKTLSEFLNCDLFESDITVRIGFDIQRLYKQIRNRAQIVLAQEFLTCLLPLIVLETYNINHDTFLMTLADDRAKEFGFESRLISFMSGAIASRTAPWAIASFKALTLNKRGMA